MLTSAMCSWCDTMNLVGGLPQCRQCGHDAFRARVECCCPRCESSRRRASSPDAPAPFAPAITEALTRLRRGANQDDRPVEGTANPEGEAAVSKEPKKVTAPDTREIKRTPVSPDLAAKICDLDAALTAEFGLDVAWVLLARDGVIASSNASHGVLSPVVRADAAGGGS